MSHGFLCSNKHNELYTLQIRGRILLNHFVVSKKKKSYTISRTSAPFSQKRSANFNNKLLNNYAVYIIHAQG